MRPMEGYVPWVDVCVELTAAYVPGRKNMVRSAMPFIAELSRFEAAAIWREVVEISKVDWASLLAM